ncbi:MAG: hypothetical protein ACRDPY_06835 [Streptosporangiaceae bacterium]
MTEQVESLERRIGALRTAVREAVLIGDRERAAAMRRDLRRAEQDWEDALTQAETVSQAETVAHTEGASQAETAAPARSAPHGAAQPAAEPRPGPSPAREPAPLLPLREQVHQALSLLTVPAAPRLIATVHEAFFSGTFATARLTSLKRDEERSFRSAPFARPYYICAALTADLLAPARGLLAISTWPMDRRVIGSLSPRVDFLTAAIRVAEAIERLPRPVPATRRLLWRFAASIPGAAGTAAQLNPRTVRQAAAAELDVHQDTDQHVRQAAGQRARAQLDDAQQLFGTRIQLARQTDRGSGQ